MAKTTDLTSGKIGRSLLAFAVPLLLSSLVQQLYNTVDLIFVGNFIDKSASAAIGASSQLINCLVGFFGGMSVGAGVAVAQLFGAGKTERIRSAVHTVLALSLVGGALLFAVGFAAAPAYLRLVNTPESLQADAVSYLRIYLISLVPMFIYNLGSGVLRALGDSRSPLYAQTVGGLANVAMDYLFIRGLTGGVDGVAWATLISQTTAAGMTLVSLMRLDERYALRLREIHFDLPILRRIVAIGIPAGTQSLVITLSNVMAQVHINSLGENAIAAFTAYFKVELIIYLPIVAFGQAVMSFAGQNLGAGDTQRVREGTRVCLFMSMGVAALTSAAALCFGSSLFRLFNTEADVIALGCRIIAVTFPFYFLYSVLQVLGDSLRGVGRVKQPMYIVLVNLCLVRTALLFLIVPRFQSVESVAFTYPATWALTALGMLLYYVKYRGEMRENEKIYPPTPAFRRKPEGV
ncbi:MAG: MATE family efflux transporter [Lachnospiraceae bacterium]|nr:MATE family efflux transporter [Lachnospiraceae bacterium]